MKAENKFVFFDFVKSLQQVLGKMQKKIMMTVDFDIDILSPVVKSDIFIVLQKGMLHFSITTIINTVKIYYEH